jgi:hypothetical protein
VTITHHLSPSRDLILELVDSDCSSRSFICKKDFCDFKKDQTAHVSRSNGSPSPFQGEGEVEVELVVGSQSPESHKEISARASSLLETGPWLGSRHTVIGMINPAAFSMQSYPWLAPLFQGRKEGCSRTTWAAMLDDALVKQGCLETTRL